MQNDRSLVQVSLKLPTESPSQLSKEAEHDLVRALAELLLAIARGDHAHEGERDEHEDQR